MDATVSVSPRQRQVIAGLAEGLSEREIAERLRISPRTVKGHVDVIRQRLNVARRREVPLAYLHATGDDPYPRA